MMIKLKFIIASLALLIASCQNKGSSEQQKELKPEVSESHSHAINDTLGYVAHIDKKSIKDTVIDVLQYFNEEKLPNLYRLGGIAYQPYSLNGNLAKVVMIFEGDRETIKKSYYFNEQGEVFYVVRVYSIYEPPKWEEGSKEASVKKSAYYIFKDKVRKSTGDVVGVSEIQDDIVKVKELIELF